MNNPKSTTSKRVLESYERIAEVNDVIRSSDLELHHAYGVKEELGFRGGYAGLIACAIPGSYGCLSEKAVCHDYDRRL